MPPESVPALLTIRLLPICKLCPQPWTKMPPPPWELSVMPKPSMLDGLHQKLLENGLVPLAPPQLAAVRNVVPAGKPAARVGSYGFEGKFTPFPSTVMPAPSSAPIRLGSCNISARLPLRPASQPTVASSGNRSTCGLTPVATSYGVKPFQVSPVVLAPVTVPVG